MTKIISFMSVAKSWLNKKGLHGPHAFLRFVMLVFVQRLNEGTDEFIFKGGNLLWLYIGTPRSTVDADLLPVHSIAMKKLRDNWRRFA